MSVAKKLFISDVTRIMNLLPRSIRTRIYILFFLMFILALFEVLSILSMSFMGMSVAAPQIILDDPNVKWIMAEFPGLAEKCKDIRYFTLISAWGVVILTVLKNMLSALVGWKSSCIGEDVAIFSGSRIMNHYLNSNYMWDISRNSLDS